MAEPFATAGDLSGRYPVNIEDDLDSDRAEMLLGAASRIVRQKISGIDTRTALPLDDPSWLDPELITDVVCEMVWTALSAPAPGATQQTQSVGGVSVSTTFEYAAGRLRLTKAQKDLLLPSRARARAGQVDTLPPVPVREPGTEMPAGWLHLW